MRVKTRVNCAGRVPAAWCGHFFAFMFRIYHSDDGYVWKAYNSRLSSTDLGQVFEREAATTTVHFDPPIRV